MQQLTVSNPFQKALVFFVLIGSLVGLVPGVAGANSGTVVDEGLDRELNWVSIVDVAITRADGTRNCTGVLVSSTLVLTAAHCVSPYRVFQDGSVVHRGLPNSITIQTSPVTLRRNTGTFGEPQPEGQTRRARAWSMHPTYKFHNTYDPDNDLGGPWGLDIAAIALERAVIAPEMRIADSIPADGDWVVVGGFGQFDAESDWDGVLRHGTMTRDASCDNASFQTHLELCFDEGRTMPCYGDSGGPVVNWDSTNGDHELVGIMAGVSSCSRDDIDDNNPREMVAGRVDGVIRQWIDAQIDAASRNADRAPLPPGWFTAAPTGEVDEDPTFIDGTVESMPTRDDSADAPAYDSEIECILAGEPDCSAFGTPAPPEAPAEPAPTQPSAAPEAPAEPAPVAPPAVITVPSPAPDATIAVEPDSGFVDVAPGAYYDEGVAWMVANGITTGTSATTYSPHNIVTRGQMAAFLWRAAGSPTSGQQLPFVDVAADAYYADAVAWMVANGITTGTSAITYSPDQVVTRGQMAAFLWRAFGRPEVAADLPFADVTANAYYADAVAWMVASDITTGTSPTTYSPHDVVTRGQMAAFMFRAAVG